MRIVIRFTVVAFIVAAAALAVVGYGLSLVADRQAQARELERMRQLAALLVRAAESNPTDAGYLQQLAASIQGHGQRQTLLFYDVHGRRVVPESMEATPIAYARAQQVMARGQVIEETAQGSPALALILAPLRDPHTHAMVGALELRRLLDETAPLSVFTNFSAALLFLVIFTAAVGILAYRSVQRPIRQLTHGMGEITAGNLDHVLPLGRAGEIGKIAYLFNEMSSRLRAAQNEIAESAATKLSLEARVHHSEKLATLGQLAAEIAHEIGTPLSVIGGRATNIKRKIDQPAEVTKNAEIIAAQVIRITSIIRQMLDFAGKAPLHRRPCDVVEIFRNTLALLEDRCATPRVQIVWDVPAAIPRIPVDAESMEQVALNLVINAIHAMPEGGTLTIRAAVEPHRKGGLESMAPTPHLVLTVEDNGVGIPEEIRPRVFEAFFSTKAKGEGTGLGLTITQNIIKAHDGWIEVLAAEPRGTAFRVFLPAELDATQSRSAPSAA